VGVGWPRTPEELYGGSAFIFLVAAIWLAYRGLEGILYRRMGPWPLLGLFIPILGRRAILTGIIALAFGGACAWFSYLSASGCAFRLMSITCSG
jgi:hypothetical protein